MKIGVFDSGVGGMSVANAIKQAMPQHEVLFREDREHVPYGSRTPEEILGFVKPILLLMVEDGCQIIVIACNTVSTTLITTLRDRVKVPLIAMEPMVKPASQLTSTGVIAVCATPATLKSERYNWLKQTYCEDIQVIEPDCSDWSYMIEHKQIDEQKIAQRTTDCLNHGADVIVLGCTHYHWIEREIKQIAAGRAEVIQPEQAIVARLENVMRELGDGSATEVNAD